MYTRFKMRRNYQNYNIFCAHSQLWNIQQYDHYSPIHIDHHDIPKKKHVFLCMLQNNLFGVEMF